MSGRKKKTGWQRKREKRQREREERDRRGSDFGDDRRGGRDGERPAKRQAPSRPPPIDREKVCPLLLRVFPRIGGAHRVEDFASRDSLPAGETHIYTWQDATLREIADLVAAGCEPARRPSARLALSLVYPDRTGRNVMRQIGTLHASRAGSDDNATLRQVKFQTGDYLAVAIS